MRSVISEQGNKSIKLKGLGEQRQFWGKGNIENQDFDFIIICNNCLPQYLSIVARWWRLLCAYESRVDKL